MPRGIPTTYRGVRFRSRLEARWAAFFDRCNWKWSYEPLDLEGYIPDFLLHFDANDLLIEVKPTRPSDDHEQHADKIMNSGWRAASAILCATWDEESSFSVRVGAAATFIQDAKDGDDEYAFGDWGDALLVCCAHCRGPAIMHSLDWPTCLRCGFNARDSEDDIPPYTYVKLRALDYNVRQRWWIEAGNEVQWKPPQ